MSISSISISGEYRKGHTAELILSPEEESSGILFLNIYIEDENIRINTKDLIIALRAMKLLEEANK